MTEENGHQDFVEVTVTSNLNEFVTIRRFSSDVTFCNLKGKLELLTGADSSTMKLQLRNKDGDILQDITDDKKSLRNLNVENGMIIHVIEPTNKATLISEDTPDVAFKLSDEAYSKKEDTMKNFLMKKKLGKYDDEKLKKKEDAEEEETRLSKSIQVGDRCEVQVAPVRRGQVLFVGNVEFKPGIWVGVKYDEPLGKNDGSINGKRYFECPPKYGAFVRPSSVTVGDFPEIDPFEEI